jgi:hypothetical protein
MYELSSLCCFRVECMVLVVCLRRIFRLSFASSALGAFERGLTSRFP